MLLSVLSLAAACLNSSSLAVAVWPSMIQIKDNDRRQGREELFMPLYMQYACIPHGVNALDTVIVQLRGLLRHEGIRRAAQPDRDAADA